MDEKENFAKNLRFLRLLYGLSLSEMAMIINLKSKSALSTLENAKNPPSFETLINIANVFAVKVDWLVGRTFDNYDEIIISELEEQMMDIKLADNTVFRDIVPNFYLNSSVRNINFSLFARADLILFLHFLKAIIEKYPQLLHKNIDAGFWKSLEKRKNIRKRWSKKPDELYMQLLWHIGIVFYKHASD